MVYDLKFIIIIFSIAYGGKWQFGMTCEFPLSYCLLSISKTNVDIDQILYKTLLNDVNYEGHVCSVLFVDSCLLIGAYIKMYVNASISYNRIAAYIDQLQYSSIWMKQNWQNQF